MNQQHRPHSRTGLQVRAAGRSDTGRVREQNEDAIALCEPPGKALLATLGRLYLLADGAGGHAAGEVASKTAVETIASTYYEQMASTASPRQTFDARNEASHLHGPLPDLDLPLRRIQHTFFAAHTRILELAARQEQYRGMATTCVAAVVKGTHLLIAHIGDSRAYLIQSSSKAPPTLTRLTVDHSMVTALAQAGVIAPEQVHTLPSRHIILRALGGNRQDNPDPDITTCRIQAGDYLVLCCDGLWRMLTEEQMATVVSKNSPQAACDRLVGLANEAGGEDNISVVVLSFT